MDFKLHAPYQPTGDQPQAIEALTRGVELGFHEQVMLGVTGSGKTFTMANIIARLNRPTLVLAHNKTLAAQLCAEFREFFPENAVEYFVSYYDYYQPEAYIPHTDTYIEKDAATNDEIYALSFQDSPEGYAVYGVTEYSGGGREATLYLTVDGQTLRLTAPLSET